VAATLRFGPDGKQYIGLGSVEDPDAAQNLSAPAGKILRLDADGRTPQDNPSASPVLTLGHRDPRGLAWLDGSMWEVEGGESGDELNRIRASANYGWPGIENGGRGGLAAPAMSLAGPAFSGIAAPDSSSALGGDLVIAALNGEDLFRVRIGRDGRPRVVSRLLQRRFGRIAQVAAGSDGALYFITANAGPREPHEALIRLTVRAPHAPAGAHRP
jgi:glucose/arabinose dehydrogenase